MREGELKACPFCGGKAVVEAYGFGQYSVQCHTCRQETDRFSGWENAVEFWNRRTPGPMTSVVTWVRYDKANDDTIPEPGKEVLVLDRYDRQTLTIGSLGVTQSSDPTRGDSLGFFDTESLFISELREGDLWAYLPTPQEQEER